MPQLIKTGLIPMGVSDVMRARLEAIKSCPEQKDFWLNNFFDTIDGVAYHSGKVKVVCDAQPLKDIQPDTELSYGALILTPQEYAELDGEEFSRAYLAEAGLGGLLEKSKVNSHPVWRALARDDYLLREFTNAVFAEVKEMHGTDIAMGIYLCSEQKSPIMRAWFVYYLNSKSNANGGDYLNGGGARLVGLL